MSRHDDVCPICRCALEASSDCRATPCGHVCHAECLLRWLYRSKDCPYCRSDLPQLLFGREDSGRETEEELVEE